MSSNNPNPDFRMLLFPWKAFNYRLHPDGRNRTNYVLLNLNRDCIIELVANYKETQYTIICHHLIHMINYGKYFKLNGSAGTFDECITKCNYILNDAGFQFLEQERIDKLLLIL